MNARTPAEPDGATNQSPVNGLGPSALDIRIIVTTFPDAAAQSKAECSLSMRQLAARITATSAPTKAELPWLKLAAFGEERTEKGSLRHNANVLLISGVEGDYDGKQVQPEQAADMLRSAGIAAVVYTSPSHKPDAPKWRVLCPAAYMAMPDERKALAGRLNGLLGGILARESFTLSQSFYFGRVADNPDHRMILIDGRCIDEAAELDSGVLYPARQGGIGVELPPAKPGVEPDEYAKAALAKACGLFDDPKEDRHQRLLAATNALAPFCLSGHLDAETVQAELTDAMIVSGREPNDGEIESALAGATRFARPYEPPTHGDEFDKVEPEDSRQRPAADSPLILNRDAPLASAQELMIRCHMHGLHHRTLHHQSDTFFSWTGTHYRAMSREDARASTYRFLGGACHSGKETLMPFNPTRSRVADVLEALAAVAQLPGDVTAPAWLGNASDRPPATEMLPCGNGLLHLPTRRLLPHTPAFFGVNALPYPFDPNAPEPAGWLRFLRTIWPDDPASVETLQELFGLLLTGNTAHQKIFLVVGPKRSGKGTIARVLTAMLGRENVGNPTLASLATNFGLEPLIGKPLAVISDARLGGRTDAQIVAERLLSISGEDGLTIDRKFRSAWSGTLPTRFVVMSNELPRLTDASGALASRFIVLQMQRSFFGEEDHGLTNRLLHELPGILVWALAGLDRLTARGHFVQPTSAREMLDEMADLGSPVGAFVRERCEVGPNQSVGCDTLYGAWGAWCRERNRDNIGTKELFGRDLRAVLPTLNKTQPRGHDGKQHWTYHGVALRTYQSHADDLASLI